MIPDTISRFERTKVLLTKKERWASRDLRDIFMDHQNAPTSICRHVDNSVPEHLQTETVGSFIFDLFNKKIHATYGQPCRNDYQEVSFSSSSRSNYHV